MDKEISLGVNVMKNLEKINNMREGENVRSKKKRT